MRRRLVACAIALFPMAATPLAQRAGGPAMPATPTRPAPRWPDGHVNLGSPPGERGLWERRNEHLVVNPNSYQAAATRTARVHIDQVPLQPWARALTDYRHSLSLASEPYTRCKPAGGPRQLMSPYGLEIVELPALKQVFVFNVSNANSYRIIYLDGRTHPTDLTPGISGTRSATGRATRSSSTASASARSSG